MLLVPNVVALIGLATLVTAIELQTRVVEEPYLLRTHGDAYAQYARSVGRFIPRVGRLRRAAARPMRRIPDTGPWTPGTD